MTAFDIYHQQHVYVLFNCCAAHVATCASLNDLLVSRPSAHCNTQLQVRPDSTKQPIYIQTLCIDRPLHNSRRTTTISLLQLCHPCAYQTTGCLSYPTAGKSVADYIKDDPETGSFNMAHEVNMLVQKAKEWPEYCAR
jgi:hypothetical protein